MYRSVIYTWRYTHTYTYIYIYTDMQTSILLPTAPRIGREAGITNTHDLLGHMNWDTSNIERNKVTVRLREEVDINDMIFYTFMLNLYSELDFREGCCEIKLVFDHWSEWDITHEQTQTGRKRRSVENNEKSLSCWSIKLTRVGIPLEIPAENRQIEVRRSREHARTHAKSQ